MGYYEDAKSYLFQLGDEARVFALSKGYNDQQLNAFLHAYGSAVTAYEYGSAAAAAAGNIHELQNQWGNVTGHNTMGVSWPGSWADTVKDLYKIYITTDEVLKLGRALRPT